MQNTPKGVIHSSPGQRPGLTITIKSHPEWVQHVFQIHRQCMLRPYRAISFCIFVLGRCPGLVYPPLSGANPNDTLNLNPLSTIKI